MKIKGKTRAITGMVTQYKQLAAGLPVVFRGWDSDPSQQAFNQFFAAYAPKLWGIILLANLPLSPHSEEILINVLLKAWQQRASHPVENRYFLSRLLALAYEVGLPAERVRAVLKAHL